MAMTDVWSSGIWTVLPGRGDEFVAAWLGFAEWSRSTHGATRAWLLRDRAHADRFLSVGPWPSEAAIEAWRSDPGFKERIGRIRELLDDVAVSTLDPVAWLEY
jgi:quinol monooxygenase YgiN